MTASDSGGAAGILGKHLSLQDLSGVTRQSGSGLILTCKNIDCHDGSTSPRSPTLSPSHVQLYEFSHYIARFAVLTFMLYKLRGVILTSPPHLVIAVTGLRSTGT